MDNIDPSYRLYIIERKLSAIMDDIAYVFSKINLLEKELDKIQSILEQDATERIDGN